METTIVCRTQTLGMPVADARPAARRIPAGYGEGLALGTGTRTLHAFVSGSVFETNAKRRPPDPIGASPG